MRLKTLPIFFAFFVMGVADAMGPMSDGVKNAYKLDNVMSTLLSFFVFIAFAVFSVPGGLLAARIGKKNLLLLGLALNAVALAGADRAGTSSTLSCWPASSCWASARRFCKSPAIRSCAT